MQKIYSTAKICSFSSKANCGLGLEPGTIVLELLRTRRNFSVGTFVEITEIMRKSRNFDELKWVWHQWHDQSGGKMRGDYSRFVQLSNEAARMNSNIQFITYFMSEVTCCLPRL
jgi:peptidyl-dipeptidase A